MIDAAYVLSIDEGRWERFVESIPADWPFPAAERFHGYDESAPIDYPADLRTTRAMYRAGLGLVAIWRDVIDRGLETVLVLEDDAAPVADLALRWRATVDELAAIDWGWCYLGWQSIGRRPENIGANVARLRSPLIRSHAIVFRRHTLEMLVEASAAWRSSFDHNMARFHMVDGVDVVCINPPLFGVRRERSTTIGDGIQKPKQWKG